MVVNWPRNGFSFFPTLVSFRCCEYHRSARQNMPAKRTFQPSVNVCMQTLTFNLLFEWGQGCFCLRNRNANKCDV